MVDRVQQTIANYNKVAAHYVQQTQHTAPVTEINKFIELMKPHGKIIDIGCAGGRDTQTFKNRGFDVVGIDLSEEMIKIAKQNHPDIQFVLADMRKLPFKDMSFDGVCAIGVLHHLEKGNMMTALQEWYRVLSLNGLIYIKTKIGEQSLTTHEDRMMGEKREFTLLTLNEMDEMLVKAGFSKISLYSTESVSRKGLFWIDAFYRKV